MFKLILAALTVFPACLTAQTRQVAGTYANMTKSYHLYLYTDSTFSYQTTYDHPVFWGDRDFSEQGRWTLSGDTVVLNPQLPLKAFVETELQEQAVAGDTNVLLTFNHIKRYYDAQGALMRADTVQVRQLDFAFNDFKKHSRRRVAEHRSVRCTFAGYIPKEIITPDRTIAVARPVTGIQKIYIGCWEMSGTKPFPVADPQATRFVFNVYSNYYADGLIRQMKFLVKNNKVLYTQQRPDGSFVKDNIWHGTDFRIQRVAGL